jgi:hypothetical protein
LSITWDAEKLGISAQQVRQRLSDGDPRIEIPGGPDSLTINPYMMEEGEEVIVAQRLTQTMSAA